MKEGPFELRSERLGPLPLINHFIERLGLPELIDTEVPTSDGRCRLAYAKATGVLIRSIATEREPVYRLAEAVSSFAPEGFGLDREEAGSLTDDAACGHSTGSSMPTGPRSARKRPWST